MCNTLLSRQNALRLKNKELGVRVGPGHVTKEENIAQYPGTSENVAFTTRSLDKGNNKSSSIEKEQRARKTRGIRDFAVAK